MGRVSRRGFLKGAGTLGVAAATAGVIGLAGCSSGSGDGGYGNAHAQGKGTYAYSVHESDVVVIGSGLSGLHAAWRAMKDGRSVTILDKSRYGHSGNSGMNWGNMFGSTEFVSYTDEAMAEAIAGKPKSSDGLLDQDLAFNIEKAWSEAMPVTTAEQLGCILERKKDGEPTFTSASAAGFMPRVYAQKIKRMGATIRDRTFAQSLLFTEGKERIAGVVAIDLRDGAAHVYRAKAVVMAAGSNVWVSGWNGMRAHTHGSSDLTGEGLGMLIEAGIPMADCEIYEQDQTQYEPLAVRNTVYTMGSQVTSFGWTYNNDNELFALPLLDANAISQGPFMRLTQREIFEGRGTEHGGLWADTTNMDRVERFWRRTKEDLYRTLGYEVPDRTEVTPHFWATGIRPYDLTENSETIISGLFYAGEGPYVFNGGSTNSCIGTGWMSGRGAAQVANSTDLPTVVWDDVQAALTHAYSSIEKEGEGIRPFDMMRKVQDVFWQGLGLIRNEDGIQAAITELERLKKEELPSMVCPDKSHCLNNEWRIALEVGGMLDTALATGYASTKRQMSRGGTYCRSDYPELGDELYNTVTTFDGKTWAVETQPIRDTYISAQDILASEIRISFAHGIEG